MSESDASMLVPTVVNMGTTQRCMPCGKVWHTLIISSDDGEKVLTDPVLLRIACPEHDVVCAQL